MGVWLKEGEEKKNLWGLGVFSLETPKYFLPKLEREPFLFFLFLRERIGKRTWENKHGLKHPSAVAPTLLGFVFHFFFLLTCKLGLAWFILWCFFFSPFGFLFSFCHFSSIATFSFSLLVSFFGFFFFCHVNLSFIYIFIGSSLLSFFLYIFFLICYTLFLFSFFFLKSSRDMKVNLYKLHFLSLHFSTPNQATWEKTKMFPILQIFHHLPIFYPPTFPLFQPNGP